MLWDNGGICLVRRADLRNLGAGVAGLAGEDRGRCGRWIWLAPAAAIGYGIGRIGCFLSGDGCYGIEIKPVHFLGFTFHALGNGLSERDAAGSGAGLSDAALRVWRGPADRLVAVAALGKPHGTGAILGQYLALSGIARFLVEFIRRNPKVIWGLSNAQLASAGAVVVGIALTWWASTRPAEVADRAPKKAARPVEKTA